MNEKPKLTMGPIVAIFVVFIVVLASFVVIPNLMRPTTDLRLGDGIFRARIAYNETERTKGLNEETTLSGGQALLMAFPTDYKWKIGVENLKVPVDIIWLNNDKQVVYIWKNILPGNSETKVYEPKKAARYVVEVLAGTVDSKSINANTKAIFDIDVNKVE